MPLLVKICGLRTPEALDAALDAGADQVGFVFFAPSPRNLGYGPARALGERVKGRAGKVALATNATRPLIRRIRHYIAPVYDYCLVTEPLTAAQLASIGWRNRQGLSDIPNQFHYYRLTSDNRILWGGYDAVYYWRGKVAAEHENRPA